MLKTDLERAEMAEVNRQEWERMAEDRDGFRRVERRNRLSGVAPNPQGVKGRRKRDTGGPSMVTHYSVVAPVEARQVIHGQMHI